MDEELDPKYIEEQLGFGTDLDADTKNDHCRVLVVEDDPDSALLMKKVLILSGFDVSSSSNGIEGLRKIDEIHPDITLMDLMMPDMDGWEMLSQLHSPPNPPVIVVSALSQKEAIVKALQLGADDFITKPFNNAEMIERVRAVLRRSIQPTSKLASFNKIGLSINFVTKEVLYKQQDLGLTQKEFAVMSALARHSPSMVTYDMLRLEVWGEELHSIQNRVKSLIFTLRQKLTAVDPNSNIIVTVGRRGYRLLSE